MERDFWRKLKEIANDTQAIAMRTMDAETEGVSNGNISNVLSDFPKKVKTS